MPTEHVSISDPNIHEPKGASSASTGMVYISNGSGSGVWTYFPQGNAFYQHSTSGQTITAAPTKLVIDGGGLLSNSGNLPREIRGVGEFWDPVNNTFTPMRRMDGYDIRIDIPVDTDSGAAAELTLQVDVGGNSGPTVVAFEDSASLARTTPYMISFGFPFTVLTNDTLVNGVQFFLSTDADTIELGEPGIYIAKTIDGGA